MPKKPKRKPVLTISRSSKARLSALHRSYREETVKLIESAPISILSILRPLLNTDWKTREVLDAHLECSVIRGPGALRLPGPDITYVFTIRNTKRSR